MYLWEKISEKLVIVRMVASSLFSPYMSPFKWQILKQKDISKVPGIYCQDHDQPTASQYMLRKADQVTQRTYSSGNTVSSAARSEYKVLPDFVADTSQRSIVRPIS